MYDDSYQRVSSCKQPADLNAQDWIFSTDYSIALYYVWTN